MRIYCNQSQEIQTLGIYIYNKNSFDKKKENSCIKEEEEKNVTK
jgi:hypothetical protein